MGSIKGKHAIVCSHIDEEGWEESEQHHSENNNNGKEGRHTQTVDAQSDGGDDPDGENGTKDGQANAVASSELQRGANMYML